jgi:hypothetical protein
LGENAQHVEGARPERILLICLEAVPEDTQGSHHQVHEQCKFASEIHLESQPNEECGFYYDYYGEEEGLGSSHLGIEKALDDQYSTRKVNRNIPHT